MNQELARRKKNFWWPNVNTAQDAAVAAKGGGIAFGFIALGCLISTAFIVLGWQNPVEPGAKQDPATYEAVNVVICSVAAILAWRTYRRPTPLLCTVALSWVLIEFVGKAADIGIQGNLIGAYWAQILGTVAGVGGLRGAWASRKAETRNTSAGPNTRLDKATSIDIALSCILPGWALLVGLIALGKKEYRRSLTMMAISGVLIAIIVFVDLQDSTFEGSSVASTPSLESQLSLAANEVTRSAPRMVNTGTRLDGAVAGPGLVFTYLYSLPNISASQVEEGTFETRLAPQIRESACKSSGILRLLDHNVQIRYDYRGKDGKRIGLAVVDDQSCPAR